MKKHVYQYDEIVVGNSLAALFYCYKNLCPLLFKKGAEPLAFDFFDKDFPFENLYFTNELRELKTPKGNILAGRKKLEIYNKLLFLLSAAGLMPYSDKIKKVRVEDKQLRVSLSRGNSSLIEFKKLRIFTSDFLEGLPLVKIEKQKLKVLDTLKIISQEHDFDLIKTNDDFVKEIYFVNSEKRRDVKHIMVVSFLDKEEVENFDFSIIPLKYKLKNVLEQSGIKKRNSKNHLELDFIERKIYNEDRKVYKSKGAIIDTRTEEDVCQNQRLTTHLNLLDVYPWRLHHLLLDSSGMIR